MPSFQNVRRRRSCCVGCSTGIIMTRKKQSVVRPNYIYLGRYIHRYLLRVCVHTGRVLDGVHTQKISKFATYMNKLTRRNFFLLWAPLSSKSYHPPWCACNCNVGLETPIKSLFTPYIMLASGGIGQF